jgi:hypothetical protein
MRVNRRFLYWGVVLIAIGGVLVVADLTAVDTTTLTDLIRLWPLAIVAIGVSLLARRTRLALPALLAAALIPGLVMGAAFAVVPRYAGHCGARGDVANVASQSGTFDGPATSRSGAAAASSTSRLRPATAGRSTPRARPCSGRDRRDADLARDQRLRQGPEPPRWGPRRVDLVLPTSDIASLELVVTTGDGRADLAGARLGDVSLTANAGRAVVDASGAASLRSVTGVVNVGAMSLDLPATSDFTGSFTVGAGKLDLCTAPGLGLRVTSSDTGGNVSVAGLDIDSGQWESSDYRTAPHRADLTVHVTFGAVDINPIGGCK